MAYVEFKVTLEWKKQRRERKEKGVKKPQETPLLLGPAGQRSSAVPSQASFRGLLSSAVGPDNSDDFSPLFPLAWHASDQDPLTPTTACSCSRWDQSIMGFVW